MMILITKIFYMKTSLKKYIFLSGTITIILQFALAQSQPFEGSLLIKTLYKKDQHDTLGIAHEFTMMIKGELATTEHKSLGKIILNMRSGELHVIVGQGSQPVVWKAHLQTLNQVGGLLLLMKAATGQDVMTITPASQFQKTKAQTTISGYKCTKYTLSDAHHTGHVWIAENSPHDLSDLWSALNIKHALDNSGINGNYILLKATSKSHRTGESNSLTIVPRPKSIEKKIFELPANAQIIDITPMLLQMMQHQKPEEVQKMLLQMMPAGK